MNSESSRKRGGEQMDNEPAEKVQAVLESTPDPDNVVLVVDGEEFVCSKKKLAEHSDYFNNMFFTSFLGKDKEEVELGGVVTAQVFQLFKDSLNNINSINDTNVEKALFAAGFLQSLTLERMCLQHLAENSDYNSREKLQLAQNTSSRNLATEICNSIREAWELDELLPTNLGTLSKDALEIILQRSIELHGYRNSPPTLVEPDQKFEFMVNQIIGHAEFIQNQGEAIIDQLYLLEVDLWIDQKIMAVEFEGIDQDVFNSDLEIADLMKRSQSARDVMEQNYYQTRAQVLKLKHLCAVIESADPNVSIFEKQASLSALHTTLARTPHYINRNRGIRAGARELALGNRPVDERYRTMVANFEDQVQVHVQLQGPHFLHGNSLWQRKIQAINNRILRSPGYIAAAENVNLPDGIRHVSHEAQFKALDTLIRNVRYQYYGQLQEFKRDSRIETRTEASKWKF